MQPILGMCALGTIWEVGGKLTTSTQRKADSPRESGNESSKVTGLQSPRKPRASHTHFDKLSLSKIQESQYNEAQILSLFSEMFVEPSTWITQLPFWLASWVTLDPSLN